MFNLVIVRDLKNAPSPQIWNTKEMGEYAQRKIKALGDTVIVNRPLTEEETKHYTDGYPLDLIFAQHLEAAKIACQATPTI